MWLSIILALLTYFGSSKGTPAEKSKALLNAALVGGVTYGATQTEWGKANLMDLDNAITGTGKTTTTKVINGVEYEVPDGATVAVNADGSAILDANGLPKLISAAGVGTTLIAETGKVLTSWGGTGTAAVIGTTALATSSDLQKYLPWIIGAVAAFVILK